MLNNLNQVEQHDYSQNYFVGKVVYNQDPLGLRRVKVSIPNLFDDDHTKLPWVAPMFFGFIANGNGGGSANLSPAVGTEVIVEFQMGSPLHGLYISSPMRPGNLPAEFVGADAQWTYGWKDPAGNLFLINTKPGANTIKVHHASGTQVQVVNNGDTAVTVVGKADVNVTGDTHLTVGGTTTLDSTGAVNVNTSAGVHVNGSTVTVQGGDVVADGISLKSHTHSGVQRGLASTDGPH